MSLAAHVHLLSEPDVVKSVVFRFQQLSFPHHGGIVEEGRSNKYHSQHFEESLEFPKSGHISGLKFYPTPIIAHHGSQVN